MLQENVANCQVTLDKIPRECHMADMMTHALPWGEFLKHMTAMGFVTQERKLDPKNVERQLEHFAWLNTRKRMQCDCSLHSVRTVHAEGGDDLCTVLALFDLSCVTHLAWALAQETVSDKNPSSLFLSLS